MIVPRSPNAQFDGESQGWMVYVVDSERGCVKTQRAQQFLQCLEHYPTVTDGIAIMCYLLPGGEIDFARTAGQDQ